MILNQCLFRKTCIQKMQLCIPGRHLEKFQPIMDQSFRAAIERNVSELVIKILYLDDLLYSIPGEVVVADSLKVLQLERCMLEDHNTCIDLPHLRKLKLYICRFSGENVLPKILCGCPRMEFLEVSYCDGAGSFLSPYHGAILSAEYVPIQHLLRKYLYIEELKFSGCEGVDKIQISSSRLKGLVINNCGRLHGVEINTPNLLSLEYICLHERSLYNWFCSWKVSKVEEVHLWFSAKEFQSACRSGLKGFLMKLQNYEALKLLIGSLRTKDFIMHEKLHAVSFSSLNKLLRKVNATYVIISSRRDESFLGDMVALGKGPKNLSLISSSQRNIELVHKKLSEGEKLKCFYSEFKLVSMEEIEHEMDSAFKSFVKTHSNGYHTAGIILIERS